MLQIFFNEIFRVVTASLKNSAFKWFPNYYFEFFLPQSHNYFLITYVSLGLGSCTFTYRPVQLLEYLSVHLTLMNSTWRNEVHFMYMYITGLDTSWCQVVAQRASSFRQLLALSLVIQVLSVHSIKGECNFLVAPRASIPGDLLALSDFYWPRANGPVLVSNPDIMK